MLEHIDLSKYSKKQVHFITYALQQTQIPSQQSIQRSETKNSNKSGVTKAANIGRRPRRIPIPARLKIAFIIPNRYGPKPVRSQRVQAGRRGRGGRGRGQRFDRGRFPLPMNARLMLSPGVMPPMPVGNPMPVMGNLVPGNMPPMPVMGNPIPSSSISQVSPPQPGISLPNQEQLNSSSVSVPFKLE